MRRNFFILIFLIIINFLYGEKSSFLGGSFIDDGIGARPSGLGGCYTAIADDGNASWWNPAGLAFFDIKKKSMSFTYIPDFLNIGGNKISRFFIGYGQGDLSGYGALGASINYLTVNIGGDYTGDNEYSWTEYVILFSWGLQIDKYIGWVKYKYPKLAIGVNLKYLSTNSDLSLDGNKVSASGFGVDVSILLALKDNLNIGVMGQNVFSQVKWSSGQDELVPYTLKAGIYYGITENFLLSGEIRTEENDRGIPSIYNYGFGTEYIHEFGKSIQIKKVGIRGGVTIDPNNDSYIISGGASLYMEGFSVDYTYQYFLKTLFNNNTQRFGVTVLF